MARQANESRVGRTGRSSSGGAAVLDRPDAQKKCVLQEEIARLGRELEQGHLAERGRIDRFEDDDRSIVESVNAMLDAVIGPLKASAGYVERIAKGDVPSKITETYAGDFSEIKNHLNDVIEVMNARNLDVQKLVEASKAGRFDYRADSTKYTGVHAKLMNSINEILDANLLPARERGRVLQQISAGKIDELITQAQQGENEQMRQAINKIASTLQGLQKELVRLTEASKEGQFSERGKPDQFKGAYAGI